MRNRNLNGIDIEFLGKGDGVVDGLASFPGQAKDEITMDHQSELVAVLGKLAGPLDGRTFLDIFENLRIAGLEAYDE